MRLKKTKNKPPLKNISFLILIIFFSILFRFYKLSELFQFSLDEEYWSYMIQRVIAYKDFPLIGLEVSSTKIFMGPLFIYFHVPFYLISQLHPISAALFWSGVGVITTVVVYFFTKKFFSNRTAIFSSFLYASSFTMALHDRRIWNVTSIPIVAILSAWLLLKSLTGGKYSLILAVLVLSFGIQSHPSAFAVVAGFLLVFLFNGGVKLWLSKSLLKKELIFAAGLFIALNILPLVFFDLRHNFWEAKAIKNFIMTIGQKKDVESNADLPGIITRFSQSMGALIYLGSNIDVANEMSHCQPIIDTRPQSPPWAQFIGLTIIAWMLIYCFKNKTKPLSQFIIILTLVNLAGLFFYRERVFTYHFAPLMPFFFIFLGKLMAKTFQISSLGTIGLFLAFIIINSYSLLTAVSEMSFTTKEKIVQTIINETKNQNIAVNFLPSCELYGYRYIFTIYQKPVRKSWVDHILGWMYPEETSDQLDSEVFVAVPDAGKTQEFDQHFASLNAQADKTITVGKSTIFFQQKKP